MNVTTYLGQLRNVDKIIKDKIQEAEMWREIATKSSSCLSDMKVQTSTNPDKMGDAITLAVMYESESKELARMLAELKHTIICQIDNIGDENSYNVLKGYYIKNMTFTDLGIAEKRSYKQVKKNFNYALETFDNKYGEEYKDKRPILPEFRKKR